MTVSMLFPALIAYSKRKCFQNRWSIFLQPKLAYNQCSYALTVVLNGGTADVDAVNSSKRAVNCVERREGRGCVFERSVWGGAYLRELPTSSYFYNKLGCGWFIID